MALPAGRRPLRWLDFAPNRTGGPGTIGHHAPQRGPFGPSGPRWTGDPFGDGYGGEYGDRHQDALYDEEGREVWVRGRVFILAALAGWAAVALIVLLVIGVVSLLS